MGDILQIKNYRDKRGNRIIWHGKKPVICRAVRFFGRNNTLVMYPGGDLTALTIIFSGSNSVCRIGKFTKIRGKIHLGDTARILIDAKSTSTESSSIAAMAGTKITIGRDCMLAAANKIWSGDFHSLYDVKTGKHMHRSADITIKDHVWLGSHAAVLAGATIEAGSVIGYGATVTGRIPNNVVAVGAPAKVVRKHVAWERTSTLFTDAKAGRYSLVNSEYWNLTALEMSRPQRGVLAVCCLLARPFMQPGAHAALSADPQGFLSTAEAPLFRLLRRILNLLGPDMFHGKIPVSDTNAH